MARLGGMGRGKIGRLSGALCLAAALTAADPASAEERKMRTLRLEHNGNAISNVQAMEEANIFNRGSGNITVGGSGSCFIKQAGNAAINCSRVEKGSRK